MLLTNCAHIVQVDAKEKTPIVNYFMIRWLKTSTLIFNIRYFGILLILIIFNIIRKLSFRIVLFSIVYPASNLSIHISFIILLNWYYYKHPIQTINMCCLQTVAKIFRTSCSFASAQTSFGQEQALKSRLLMRQLTLWLIHFNDLHCYL